MDQPRFKEIQKRVINKRISERKEFVKSSETVLATLSEQERAEYLANPPSLRPYNKNKLSESVAAQKHVVPLNESKVIQDWINTGVII